MSPGRLWAAAIPRIDGGRDDGVHLVWAPPTVAGYALDGFMVQRRRSRKRREVRCFDLTTQLDELHVRRLVDQPFGSVWFSDVPCPERPSTLPDEPFTERIRPTRAPRRACVDLQEERPGKGANPRVDGDVSFEATAHNGKPAESTQVLRVGDVTGLDVDAALTIRVNDVDAVDLTLFSAKFRVQVEALRTDGTLVDRVDVAPADSPQRVRLEGRSIAVVRVERAESDASDESDADAHVLVTEVCAESKGTRSAVERLESLRLNVLGGDRARAGDGTGASFVVGPSTSYASMAAAQHGGCHRYRVALAEPHQEVRVTIGVPAAFLIARSAGKTVAASLLADPSGVQHAALTELMVDEVLITSGAYARQLEVCLDAAVDAIKEEAEWSSAAVIAKGLQVPIRTLDASLGSAADELARANSRLQPGESLDPASFAEVAETLNDAVGAATCAPTMRTTQTRGDTRDPFLELRAWQMSMALLSRSAWRRAVGFGFLDNDPALVPGEAYDYRISGSFLQRDVGETLLGFHGVPSGVALPASFHLGTVRVTTDLPSQVELVPQAAPAALRSTGRNGLRLGAAQRVLLEFATPIERIAFDLQAGALASMQIRASLGPLGIFTINTALAVDSRSELEFATPVDRIELVGDCILHGLRFPTATKWDTPVTVSAVLSGVVYAPTAPPATSPFLGTTSLQQPVVVGDPAITTQSPPKGMGFELSWLPPPSSGLPALPPWPGDLDSGPPFDAAGFAMERRRVDVATAWLPVDDDGDPDSLFGAQRGARSASEPLQSGVDLLAQFPDTPRRTPPVELFLTAPDVLISEETGGPPPGSLHQYRVSTVDLIGRRSIPRTGSVVRLEKHRPPPKPVGPGDTSPDDGVAPGGVRARVLQSNDSELSAADRALLGTHTNAILIEWGWTRQERDADPYATEYRVYFDAKPPDEVHGELVGTATFVGGRWQMTAVMDRPLPANAMAATFVRNGGRPFRVAAHPSGSSFTVELHPSLVQPTTAPSPGPFVFRPKLDGSDARSGTWAERVAVVPITADESPQALIFDRLTLDAAHPRARAWVGVSAADAQTYIADERATATPLGARSGNESSVATVAVAARYLGRPTFVVPLPLPDVPEQVTREPTGEQVTATIDLPTLLPALAIPAGHRVLVERIAFDTLLPMMGALPDGRVQGRFPDGSTAAYTLANPGDQAKLLSLIGGGDGAAVEGKFVMDFLLRFAARLEPEWRRALPEPVEFAAIVDALSAKADRHVHRIRLVDAAGHFSEGAAIVPQILRVASLRVPRAPELVLTSGIGPDIGVRGSAIAASDLGSLVVFSHAVAADAPLDEKALRRARVLRVPDRRDLYPNNGMRLRLPDGSLLAPATTRPFNGAQAAPPRVFFDATLHPGYDKRAAVWAVTMTRDGIPSAISGPLLAFSGASPIVVPTLSVTLSGGMHHAVWAAVDSGVETAVERAESGSNDWARVTPWLNDSVHAANLAAPATAHVYRLQLRSSRARTAAGPTVTPN